MNFKTTRVYGWRNCKMGEEEKGVKGMEEKEREERYRQHHFYGKTDLHGRLRDRGMGTGASRFAHKSTCNLQCMPWTPVRHSSGNAAATRPSYSYRVRRCGTPSIVAQNCSLSTMVGDKTANRWPWWIAAFLLYTQHHCPPTKTRQIHPRIIIVVRYTLRGSRVDYRLSFLLACS